eukprot:XP_001698788.1 predicted protein [Chlamydomonas reinhardtii]
MADSSTTVGRCGCGDCSGVAGCGSATSAGAGAAKALQGMPRGGNTPSAQQSATSGQADGSTPTSASTHPPWRFSVMCYNVLADTYAHHFASKLYRDVPRRCLEWPARRSLLLAEIRHWAPDVVCLQEVQHYHELEPEMRAAGRSDRLRACSATELQFARLGLEDNVAMLLSLAPRALSAVRLLVATTHITFDPAKGDVKLGQTLAIITGDFNSTAGSPLYQFVAQGALDLATTSRKKLSGEAGGGGGGWKGWKEWERQQAWVEGMGAAAAAGKRGGSEEGTEGG